MPDSTLSQAIKEAYASAPSDVVIYHTIELRHPSFTSPIRVVRDFSNLSARLEASAPVDANNEVMFVAMAFEFTKPEVSAAGVPQITLEMDNVARAIVANVEASMDSTEMITCTYREYISTDLSAPQNNPPLSMTILSISATAMRVTATAGFPNLMNFRFPTSEYDPEVFPGLVV